MCESKASGRKQRPSAHGLTTLNEYTSYKYFTLRDEIARWCLMFLYTKKKWIFIGPLANRWPRCQEVLLADAVEALRYKFAATNSRSSQIAWLFEPSIATRDLASRPIVACVEAVIRRAKDNLSALSLHSSALVRR
jgi:hypothetical protein